MTSTHSASCINAEGSAPPGKRAAHASPAGRAACEIGCSAQDATKEKPIAGDLLGLNDLFQPPVAKRPSAASISDEEIDRIADRVIQKLSTQVIESVAWDVVPDITAKVLREELKRQS